MKLISGILLVAIVLSGCQPNDTQLQHILDMRKRIMEGKCYSYDAEITAEIGSAIYSFQTACTADSSGNLAFMVTAPDTIYGITGELSDNSASLTFDGNVLAFPMLAEGKLTPISAPWLLLKTLRSGYLSGYQTNEDGFILSMADSYEENPLQLQIHTDLQLNPTFAEIYWQQQRVITLSITNFKIE